ncbi:hypothetical protein ANN_03577 [Periplaneta americana]|uniref:Uncharacterized protein n=1 Tax=Periplaneta americana TaxID=6978 RepID=A0ABQ8U159_PERAM|nr:hypothetical protein ANN_03577 [Periplaneta americana]
MDFKLSIRNPLGHECKEHGVGLDSNSEYNFAFRITGSTLKKKSPGRNSIALRLSEATITRSVRRHPVIGECHGIIMKWGTNGKMLMAKVSVDLLRKMDDLKTVTISTFPIGRSRVATGPENVQVNVRGLWRRQFLWFVYMLRQQTHNTRRVRTSVVFRFVKVIFSDEITFHINEKVNKHNVRIWESENPHFILEVERDSPKLNVFCAVSKLKVYGPFFFQENTVTGMNYLDMLTEWLFPQLEEEDNEFLFQQDGAPPHWNFDVRNVLNQQLAERWNERAGNQDNVFCS